jgi:SulP family sulfate permease
LNPARFIIHYTIPEQICQAFNSGVEAKRKMRIFNEIGLHNIRGDIFGGITAAVIALPMALAFGVASGAGAEAGLYGAILVGLFASLFGGSPTLISEPTGPMTVIFTAVIAKLIASDPANGMAMAFTVVVMAGMFQILFGVLRLGKYVTLMPYSVVSGFMSGIGIILIILQIGPLLGQASPSGGVISILQSIPALIAGIRPEETMLALVTIAILFFMPFKLKRYLPPQLLALVAGTVISVLLLNAEEIRRIGEIPTGLPAFQVPVFSIEQWQIMLLDAVVLGMLGCIDALLTSVVADSLTRKQHNSDKELIGQGIGNMMSGLFGGLPGAGATMGTVVSIQTGARTALSGLVRAAILIVIVLWAADLTATIPLAVLAGIALKVGIDIIDWRFLRRAHHLSGRGALIAYGVIALTVFVDLIVAVGIGLFLANVMTITRLSELQADDVKAVTDPDDTDLELTPYEHDLLETAAGKVLLLHLHGNMIFGVSRAISRKNSEVEGCKALIIDLRDVVHLGVSSALTLEETILDMVRAERCVYLVAVKGQPLERLEKMGVLQRIPAENIVDKRITALERAIYGCAADTLSVNSVSGLPAHGTG